MSVTPVQKSPRTLQITGLPLSRGEIVKKIALACLKDLAVCLLLGSTVALFVPSSIGNGFLAAAAIQMLWGIVFHTARILAVEQAAQKGKHAERYEQLSSFCEYVTGANFAVFSGFNTQLLVHETGHALAASLVYRTPPLQIEIYPFSGGITRYFKHLTPWGKTLGAPAALAFVIASGPCFTLLLSTVVFTIGLKIKEAYPQLGKYLICYGVLDFLITANYALSAVWTDPYNLIHDFVHLSIFGVNPVTVTVGVIAIPLLIAAGMHFCKKSSPSFPPGPFALDVHLIDPVALHIKTDEKIL